MSVGTIQGRIQNTQREIESLQRSLTNESDTEASKSSRIAQLGSDISRTKNTSTIRSKQNEIQRLERDIASIKKKKAAIQKRIADKTSKLHRHQRDLTDEQIREQKKFQDLLRKKQEEQTREQRQVFDRLRSSPYVHRVSEYVDPVIHIDPDPKYDAFISHASDDKDELVRPLAELLQESGHAIWYDEFQLKVGDSLRKSIDKGLAHSRFGIVVLSPSFFAKNWTEYELNGLVAREMTGGKVILPLWHKVSKDEVIRFSPPLADKLALSTATLTIRELAERLSEVLSGT